MSEVRCTPLPCSSPTLGLPEQKIRVKKEYPRTVEPGYYGRDTRRKRSTSFMSDTTTERTAAQY